MVSPRSTLRIVGVEPIGDATRVLDIVRTDKAPWTAVRGKYIILDTGLISQEGKAVKRAYSLVPSDSDSSLCRLIVKWLPGGPGSTALHATPIGSEFLFSGPWGKLVSEQCIDEPTLIVATDTGITSALGAVAFSGSELATVLWLRRHDESFLDEARTRAAIERAGARLFVTPIPSIESRERTKAAWAHVDACIAEFAPSIVLGAGDGNVVFPLKARLESQSRVRDVRIECFFNNPEKKSA
jgi:ferredoxin-NADP reductase